MIFQIARAPLQFGSIILIPVISGWTALIWNSYEGHLDIVRFLVESGANLEAKDYEYSTPKT
jgi:ankyrin repeat protein